MCHDQKTPHYKFEKLPEFPGGERKLYDYLNSKLKYPEDARESRIQGLVLVDFTIDKDGSITDVQIRSSVFKSLDEEAIRVIANMPKWKPGELDQKPIRVSYTLPVRFRLE